MSEHICRNCRWWDAAPTRLDLPQFWGECELGVSNDGERYHNESKAFALDGERYGANLATAPDFGCVQWDGRE